MDSGEAAVLKGLIQTKSIPAVAAAYDRALRKIELRYRPLDKGPHRARWTQDKVLQLRAAWERHGGNAYRVARDLRITEAAASTAYKRFVQGRAPPRQEGEEATLSAGTPSPSQPLARLPLAA